MTLELYKIAYEDQDESINSVIFKCKNGKIKRCSRWILKQSLFFTEKLNAYDRFDNETEFDYEEFSKEVIELFLAHLHGTSCMIATKELIKIRLELLMFLKSEGKTDVSPFERQLYENTKQKICFDQLNLGTRMILSFVDENELQELITTHRLGKMSYAGQKLDICEGHNKALFELILSETIDETNLREVKDELGSMMLSLENELINMIDNLKISGQKLRV